MLTNETFLVLSVLAEAPRLINEDMCSHILKEGFQNICIEFVKDVLKKIHSRSLE